jgi:hypothetical protein
MDVFQKSMGEYYYTKIEKEKDKEEKKEEKPKPKI